MITDLSWVIYLYFLQRTDFVHKDNMPLIGFESDSPSTHFQERIGEVCLHGPTRQHCLCNCVISCSRLLVVTVYR